MSEKELRERIKTLLRTTKENDPELEIELPGGPYVDLSDAIDAVLGENDEVWALITKSVALMGARCVCGHIREAHCTTCARCGCTSWEMRVRRSPGAGL